MPIFPEYDVKFIDLKIMSCIFICQEDQKIEQGFEEKIKGFKNLFETFRKHNFDYKLFYDLIK